MEVKTEKKGITRLLSNNEEILIEACDGKKTISLSEEIFDLCIDCNFYKSEHSQPEKSTKSVQVNVFEVIKNSTLMQIFGSLNNHHDHDFDMDQLCLTQHQVSSFCKKQRGWLRKDTYGTLFLTKVGFNYYVLHVIFLGGGLAIHRHHLGDSTIKWNGASLHRVVTPCVPIRKKPQN